MSIEQAPTNKVTFGLVHGAHHDAQVWNKLRPKLAALGHQTIAMDLPIDRTGVNFDTYAECIAEAVADHENVVLVGHSRIGRAIPRVAALVPIQRLVYLNAVVLPALDQQELIANQPPAHVPGYVEGRIITEVGGELFAEYDRSRAGIYYSDFDPNNPEIEANTEEVNAMIARLKKQNRTQEGSPLPTQPDLPTNSIISIADHVISPAYSRYVARHYLRVTGIEVPGGHTPQFLRPSMLANILHNIVQDPDVSAS